MIVFLLVWQGASMWIGNPILLPTPVEVARSFAELAGSGELITNTAASLWRLVLSFVLAAVVAVPLGFAMGLNRTVFEMIDPTVELLRPISGIAWIPLGLFILGIGDALPTAIMFYGAFFPLLINTITSVRSVDRSYVNAARTLGVGEATVPGRPGRHAQSFPCPRDQRADRRDGGARGNGASLRQACRYALWKRSVRAG